MVESLHRVMVPAEQTPIVDALGHTAVKNTVPELQQLPDREVKVTGVWRDSSRYVFSLQLSSATLADTVEIEVAKDMIESTTLSLLESMPLLKL